MWRNNTIISLNLAIKKNANLHNWIDHSHTESKKNLIKCKHDQWSLKLYVYELVFFCILVLYFFRIYTVTVYGDRNVTLWCAKIYNRIAVRLNQFCSMGPQFVAEIVVLCRTFKLLKLMNGGLCICMVKRRNSSQFKTACEAIKSRRAYILTTLEKKHLHEILCAR